ncbi:MAG: GNAT family N-acetyltransferase [Bdellovibrionales bacterium]
MAEISFRRLNKQDFSLLHRWLNEPHMRSFYQRHPVSLEEVVEKYSPRVDGSVPTHCHIALVDGVPIGKIQCYRVADYPEYGKEIGASDGISVDLFIGEPSFLGRGMGKAMLTSYLETVAFTLFPDEVSCYICHERANAAALACSLEP